MRLADLLETSKTYRARMTFTSRGSTRKGQYSTKRVREALMDAGYEVSGAIEERPENQPLQKIDLEGTREEILAARANISRILRVVSSGQAHIRFELLDEES